MKGRPVSRRVPVFGVFCFNAWVGYGKPNGGKYYHDFGENNSDFIVVKHFGRNGRNEKSIGKNVSCSECFFMIRLSHASITTTGLTL